MEWQQVFGYFCWGSPQGFHTTLTQRATTILRSERNYSTQANCMALISTLKPLLPIDFKFDIVKNHTFDEVVYRTRGWNGPQLTIVYCNRDITTRFEALNNIESSNQTVVDKTAALSLTTNRFDRFKILKQRDKVYLFTNRPVHEDIEYLRKILALLPRWFPTSEDTQEVWMSLVEATPDNLCAKLTEYFNTHTTLNKAQFIDRFKQITMRMAENTRNRIQREIDNLNGKINTYYDHIARYYVELQGHREQMLGVNNDALQEAGEELINYIEKRNGIEVLDITNTGYIQLAITSQLMFYDAEPVKRLCSRIENPTLRQFVKDVFIDNKYQFQIGTCVKLNVTNDGNTVLYTNVDGTPIKDTIWNPHLFHYNCWGSNRAAVEQAIHAHQFIAAIEQIYAATCSINVLDGAVWSRFTDDLYNALINERAPALFNHSKENRCLKDVSTGECITLKQYLEKEQTK